VIDEPIEVASIDRAFDAHYEWPAVVRYFAEEAEIAVSNVGDRGYDCLAEDSAYDFTSHWAPRSFTAKLLASARALPPGRQTYPFPPTELVSGNGGRLTRIISELAAASCQPDAFRSGSPNQSYSLTPLWAGRF